MKIKKHPKSVRIIIALGLVLTTMPLLFKEFIPMPDFARGFTEGIGLGLEITGLVLISRNLRADECC